MLCFFKDGWLNHLSPSFLIPFSIKLGLFEFSLLGNSFEVVEVYGATADWFPRENIRLNKGILFNTCFAFHSFQSNGCVVFCIFQQKVFFLHFKSSLVGNINIYILYISYISIYIY